MSTLKLQNLSQNLLSAYCEHFVISILRVNLCRPEAPEQVLWQTAKTQIKCRIMLHSSGSALFSKTKTIFRERNTNFFLKLQPVTPQYIQWIILTLLYSKTCLKQPLKMKTKIGFHAHYHLMQVKSIAECSKGAFCNTFDLH